MITFQRHPGAQYLELGGGSRPMLHPRCMGGSDVCVDVRFCFNEQNQQTVDFCVNFENLMPELGTAEFDAAFSHFAMEHVSYPKIPQFLREVFRVLKPGGKAVFCVPNTAAQINWIMCNEKGWDGKGFFEAASEKLFGSQDYPENTHKCFFDPPTVTKLFADAGFENVKVQPYGARGTDMCVEANKPAPPTAFRPNVLGTNVTRHGTEIIYDFGAPPTRIPPAVIIPTSGRIDFGVPLPGPPAGLIAQPNIQSVPGGGFGVSLPPPPPGMTRSVVCGAAGPGGVTCTRERGHDGNHAASQPISLESALGRQSANLADALSHHQGSQ